MSLSIYSKVNCAQCDLIKDILQEQNLEYNEIYYTSLFNLCKGEDFDEDKTDDIINIGSFPIIKYNDKIFGFEKALSTFDEQLIQENKNRYTIYPIEHHTIFQMYKQARASFWQPEEISLKRNL